MVEVEQREEPVRDPDSDVQDREPDPDTVEAVDPAAPRRVSKPVLYPDPDPYLRDRDLDPYPVAYPVKYTEP